MFALAHARPEMDNGANLPQDRQPPMTTKEDDLIILGDGIAQRMEGNPDEKMFCIPGGVRCSPALGGGCCPPMLPVCCSDGFQCRKTGPC